MQSHDTLMCFEVHTNKFLTILMFAGQFDPLFFLLQGNCTQIKYMYWIYVTILVFYDPGKGKISVFSFSVLKKTFFLVRKKKVSYNFYFQSI